MRVIAGTAKGRKLRSVPGEGTRPITDRAKEALFSILQLELPGSRLLDMFGGTGAVGIEALSRGAAHVDFIDSNPAAVRTIQANLESTGLAEQAQVRRGDSLSLLPRLEQSYDLIFIAPPQYKGLWLRALQLVDDNGGVLADGALVIVQIDPTEEEEVMLRTLEPSDRRRYGNVVLLFFRARDA